MWFATLLLHELLYRMTTSCPGPCKCVGLSVECANKNLLYIPNDIPNNTTILRLYGNSIQEIRKGDLDNLTSLMILDLASNKISFIHPGSFATMSMLTVLKLDGNRLTNISAEIFEGLSGLRVLTLTRANSASSNPLNIANRAFWSLVTMDTLELQSNNLRNVTMEMLFGLSMLKVLKLSDNQLQTVDKAIFTQATSLLLLDVSENPLVCSCDFVRWIYLAKERASIIGTCDSPLCLRGQSLVDTQCVEVSEESLCKTVSLTPSASFSTAYTISNVHASYTTESVSGNVAWRLQADQSSPSQSVIITRSPTSINYESMHATSSSLSLMASFQNGILLVSNATNHTSVYIANGSTTVHEASVGACPEPICLHGLRCSNGSMLSMCSCTTTLTGPNCTGNRGVDETEKRISFRPWIAIVVVLLAFSLALALALIVMRQRWHMRLRPYSTRRDATGGGKSLNEVQKEEESLRTVVRVKYYGHENPVFEDSDSLDHVKKQLAPESERSKNSNETDLRKPHLEVSPVA